MQQRLVEHALPADSEIRRAAAEVVARPHFQLDRARSDGGEPWLVTFFRWLLKPFRALFEMLEGFPVAIQWLIVVLAVLICLALIAHIVYTLAGAIRGPLQRSKRAFVSPVPKADPTTLERDAAAYAAAANYIDAIRLLLRAALRRIELAENKAFRPGITNRQLLRRYQATPLAEHLRWFVDAIDCKWYGGEPCSESDYLAGQKQHAQICRYVANR